MSPLFHHKGPGFGKWGWKAGYADEAKDPLFQRGGCMVEEERVRERRENENGGDASGNWFGSHFFLFALGSRESWLG
jgi:hypothetical protein